ncbi:MAG: CoA pyrophosphatase [Magnetococcales bacterium]|nr:CoA pyrophosphatase [Magnetococcales bacterium]MBF0321943.1 CoA pyrophosphatase [Magnetococcales bacterium]
MTLSALSPAVISDRLLHGEPHDCMDPKVDVSSPSLRLAAVLVPLIRDQDHWDLLLIRRTQAVSHHKGQIAFPGGKWESEDGSFLATALRETHEELGIGPDTVQILGSLPQRVTLSTGFLIHPFVGQLQTPLRLRPALQEVAQILTVPLELFQDPARHEAIIDADSGFVHHRYFYQEHVIWGATASIIQRFVELLDTPPSSSGCPVGKTCVL